MFFLKLSTRRGLFNQTENLEQLCSDSGLVSGMICPAEVSEQPTDPYQSVVFVLQLNSTTEGRYKRFPCGDPLRNTICVNIFIMPVLLLT